MEGISTEIKWSNTKKFLFLFFGTYFFLYIFPFPFDCSGPPIFEIRLPFYSDAIDQLSLLIGKLFFSSFELYPLLGDTPFGMSQIITFLLISLVVALVCFICFRTKINYDKTYQMILIYLRYYLGFFIISYGIIKTFDMQFGDLSYYNLDRSLGDFSNFNLLWSFMRASDGYNYFIGIVQIIAGFLLFFKRTKTLGALLVLSIMLNVVIMNICYNVSVKLYSIHLVLITLFIILPEIVRLYEFFILHKPTQLPLPKFHTEKKHLRIGRLVIRLIFIIGLPAFTILKVYKLHATQPQEGPLDGVYTTQLFVWDSDTLVQGSGVASERNNVRWKKFILEDSSAVITDGLNIEKWYGTKIDTTLNIFELIPTPDSRSTYKFNYQQTASNFILEGEWQGSKMFAKFKRKTKEDYTLTKEDLRWLQ